MRIAALVVLALACGRSRPAFYEKHDKARVTVDRIANQAFPDWARRNPNRACPDSIAELVAEPSERNDPWFHPYQMLCGKDLPPGVKGIAVYSYGEDGKSDTCDDIRSWKPDDDCTGAPSPRR